MLDIGKALDQAMRERDLSNVQVAAAIGSAEITIKHWRQSKKEPRGRAIIALVKFIPRFGELLGLRVIT